MSKYANLRAWVDSWGHELTWTDRAGAKAGAISKTEMVELIDDAENSTDDRKSLMAIVHSMNRTLNELRDENDHLREQLEKAARVGAFEQAISMLRMCATDPGAAKNYVAMDLAWDEAIAPGLPFRRVQIVFVRDDAKTPAILAHEALASRDRLAELARTMLSKMNFGENEDARPVIAESIETLAASPAANPIDLRR